MDSVSKEELMARQSKRLPIAVANLRIDGGGGAAGQSSGTMGTVSSSGSSGGNNANEHNAQQQPRQIKGCLKNSSSDVMYQLSSDGGGDTARSSGSYAYERSTHSTTSGKMDAIRSRSRERARWLHDLAVQEEQELAQRKYSRRRGRSTDKRAEEDVLVHELKRQLDDQMHGRVNRRGSLASSCGSGSAVSVGSTHGSIRNGVPAVGRDRRRRSAGNGDGGGVAAADPPFRQRSLSCGHLRDLSVAATATGHGSRSSAGFGQWSSLSVDGEGENAMGGAGGSHQRKRRGRRRPSTSSLEGMERVAYMAESGEGCSSVVGVKYTAALNDTSSGEPKEVKLVVDQVPNKKRRDLIRNVQKQLKEEDTKKYDVAGDTDRRRASRRDSDDVTKTKERRRSRSSDRALEKLNRSIEEKQTDRRRSCSLERSTNIMAQVDAGSRRREERRRERRGSRSDDVMRQVDPDYYGKEPERERKERRRSRSVDGSNGLIAQIDGGRRSRGGPRSSRLHTKIDGLADQIDLKPLSSKDKRGGGKTRSVERPSDISAHLAKLHGPQLAKLVRGQHREKDAHRRSSDMVRAGTSSDKLGRQFRSSERSAVEDTGWSHEKLREHRRRSKSLDRSAYIETISRKTETRDRKEAKVPVAHGDTRRRRSKSVDPSIGFAGLVDDGFSREVGLSLIHISEPTRRS